MIREMYLDTVTPQLLEHMQKLVKTNTSILTRHLEIYLAVMTGKNLPLVWVIMKLHKILRKSFKNRDKVTKLYSVVGDSEATIEYFGLIQPILDQKYNLCTWHQINASLTDAEKAANIAIMLRGINLNGFGHVEQYVTAALIVQIGIDRFCGCK